MHPVRPRPPRSAARRAGDTAHHLAGKENFLQSYLEQAFGKHDVTSAKMRGALRELSLIHI